MVIRKKVKTPAGGDYIEFYSFDKDGKPCDKENAETVIVREVTEDGKLLRETFGHIKKEEKEELDKTKEINNFSSYK